MRSIPLCSLILASCGLTGSWLHPDSLNYAQVQSLREGMSEEEVVRQFGPPRDRRRFESGGEGLAYPAENAQGKRMELRIAFAENGLTRWTLAPRR